MPGGPNSLSSVHVGMVIVFASYKDITVFKGGRVAKEHKL